MFFLRKADFAQEPWEALCMPCLRKQDFLQAEEKSRQNKGGVGKMEKKISPETTKKIQELQILEQSLQNILLQKQAFQMELNETSMALEEMKTAEKEIYKIVGQIMFKTSKDEVEKDLKSKKEILELRFKSLEKQENSLKDEVKNSRAEIMQKLG